MSRTLTGHRAKVKIVRKLRTADEVAEGTDLFRSEAWYQRKRQRRLRVHRVETQRKWHARRRQSIKTSGKVVKLIFEDGSSRVVSRDQGVMVDQYVNQGMRAVFSEDQKEELKKIKQRLERIEYGYIDRREGDNGKEKQNTHAG